MYKNRLSRTTKTTATRHQQFFIPRSAIAYDERLAFVESVCATLIESRFGPGFVYQRIENPSDRREPKSAVFCDLGETEPNGIVPCYAHSPLGRSYFRTSAISALKISLGRAENISTLRTQSTQRILSSVFSVPSVVKNSLGRGSP